METIQVLKSALDQMRHFLWFYMQVVAATPKWARNSARPSARTLRAGP